MQQGGHPVRHWAVELPSYIYAYTTNAYVCTFLRVFMYEKYYIYYKNRTQSTNKRKKKNKNINIST